MDIKVNENVDMHILPEDDYVRMYVNSRGMKKQFGVTYFRGRFTLTVNDEYATRTILSMVADLENPIHMVINENEEMVIDNDRS